MRRLACFVFSALAACSSTSADDGVSSDQDITTNALASKKELFDQEMLFVRVTGWNGDPDALHLQKDAARLGDAEVQIYETDARSSSYCPDAAAGALVYKSKSFSLRTSGNLTNGTPKSSYKISLDDKDDRLFGIKDLNLKSMWNDVSQMRESIAWSWMNQAGITSSRHTYAKVCVDGVKNGQPFTKYLGLYSMIEEVEKQFFKDHFGKKNGDGNIYKAYQFPDDIGAASLAYRGDTGDKYYKKTNIEERSYQLKSNYKPTDDRSLQTYDDLATLIRAVNGIGLPGEGSAKFDTPAYAARLSEVFNVKQFLRWQALNAAMGAWDNYWATEANYYLYNAGPKDAGTAVMAKPYFTWIPWDYDNTFGIDFTGGKWETASAFQFSTYDGRSNNMANMPLTANLFANDQLFAYYLDALLVGPPRGRHPMVDGRVLGRHAERVPPHRHQDVVAAHAQVARHHVVDRVVAHVAHVQLARRVRQHRARVERALRETRVVLGHAPCMTRVPLGLRCGLEVGRTVGFLHGVLRGRLGAVRQRREALVGGTGL